jgi:hypothetical protein
MRRVIKYIPAVIITVMIASSCERVIEFRNEATDPKVVIYSLLQPDSLVTVTIAASHAVFDAKYEPEQITDASVRLYRDGTLIETLAYVLEEPLPDYMHASPYSRYVSAETRPVQGSIYRIEVEVPGLGTAYGEAEVPGPVPITGIDTITKTVEWGEKEMVVKLRFADPAGEDNLYRLTAWEIVGMYGGDRNKPYSPEIPVSVIENDVSYGTYAEPLIAPKQEDDIFGMYLNNSYYLFTDELIAGKEYTLTMEYYLSQPDTSYYEFSHSYFMLQSLSRDLYLNLQSCSAHLQTRDNFLAEPVPVYTNITNGLGIVGAMSTSVISIKRGEYPVEGVYYDLSQYDRGY